jgi:3-oxoacyl-[acyl-carrier protein] reductase
VIDPGLAGRVAIVTGANQGIGAAVARGLFNQGASVLLTYLRLDPSRAAGEPYPGDYAEFRARDAGELTAEMDPSGRRAVAVEADLADPDAPERLFDTAEQLLGPVEILLNNASAWLANTFLPDRTDRFGRRLEPVDPAGHEQLFRVDVRGAALLIAEFARRHVARGGEWGRIIGLTSGGSLGFPGEVSYGAAKAAIENYTMSAAAELGRFGVTANLVHPPITDTGWITPEVAGMAAETGPLYHVARPEDVAEVVTLLASHQARFITGEIVHMH